MSKSTRPWGVCMAIVLLSAVGAGCSSGNQGTSASVVKIALEAPLSGDQASNGVDILNGATLAVDEANAKGGVQGRTIELVRADDRADPATGVKVAQQAVADGVTAVIGPYNSAVGVENLKIYLDAGIIPIHLTSNSATNGEGYTVQPKDYQIAPVEAKAITGFFHAKKVGIIYDPQTYTAGIASQVKEELGKDGATVVSFKEAKPGADSYADALGEVDKANPDLLYVSTYFPQGGVIARDLLHDEDAPPTCLMGLANQDPGFVETAGMEAAQRCSFSGVPSAENFPQATKYVTDYRAKFGKDPGTWGTFAYDSVNLLFDAVARAGSWDKAGVRQQLSNTSDYEGITGSISIDKATGNRVDLPVVILRLGDDGKYVVDPDWASFSGFGA
jgi:branched-chain amino acid transport system substrate-binding protein